MHRLSTSYLGIGYLCKVTFLLGMLPKGFLKFWIWHTLNKGRSQIYFLFRFWLLWIRDRKRRRYKVHLTLILSGLKHLLLLIFFLTWLLNFITLTPIFFAWWWKNHVFRRLILIFILFLSSWQLIWFPFSNFINRSSKNYILSLFSFK